jgi:hypothetical protein
VRFDLLNRVALYREGRELCIVQVVGQVEDDWGIRLTLNILENKFAVENEEGDMEYTPHSSFKPRFDASGAWDIVSYHNDIFTIAYLGVKLNFRQPVIDAFNRNETDWFEIWNSK